MLYWKLNTPVLQDSAFSAAWRPVLERKPPDPAAALVWGESTAKPFTMFFSLLAAKHFQYRRFFTRALESAVEDRDWASVGACCHHLWEIDAWAGQGATVQSFIPFADEPAGVLHVAGESGWLFFRPPVCLDFIAGNILIGPEEIQQKVFVLY